MIPAKNICSLCMRTDVKFFHLEESIRAPNDLRFEGHANLQAALENILNKKGKDRKATNDICQKCRHKLNGIYSLTYQHSESEKLLRQTTDVTVRLKKFKTFATLSDFKTETDDSTVSGEVVKTEYHNNFEATDLNIVTKDVNVAVLGGKYSNAADGRSFEEMEIDSSDSGDPGQITIKDEIIKKKLILQEDDIFEAKTKHNILDKDQTKCDDEFATGSCLKEPSKNVHGLNRANSEQKTEMEFKSQNMQSVDLERQNPKFTTTSSLRRHNLSNICESGKLSFNCDQCEAKYETRRSLKDHKMSHTDIAFSCNKCDASFLSKNALTKHLREVHTDAVFACDHCDATYKNKHNLNVHKEIHSGILLNCDQCDGKFKTSRNLKNHKMSHTGVNVTCDQCDKSFSNRNSLRRHIREVHTDSVFFACDHCGATYKNKRNLNVHKEIHSGILFNCDQCDAKYKWRGGLRDHKMTHTGVIFACNKCDASFSNRTGLTHHLRGVHTDAVFSCDHCDATYKHKASLEKHKLTHSGKFLNCDQCGKNFVREQGLIKHKLSQHVSAKPV